MKVLCVDDTNKPKKIPNDQWIKEGETYTVTRIVRLALQQDRFGFILKEVQLVDCFPYEYYDSNRFIPVNDKADVEMKKSVKEVNLDSVY